MSKKPMQKFMDWLQYKVTPAVQKFTERPWVHGFSAGIVKCLPFILTGCLIFFYNVVQPYFPNILPNLSAVSNYTFSMLSLLVAFMMVYQEMGSLKYRNYQVVGGLTGICAYILAMKGTTVDGVYSVTWNRFGPTGIVVAICIGLYVSIIFHLIAKLNLFKNNNTIPEFVQEWIKNIIPIFLSILLLKIVIIDLDVDLYPIVLKLFAPINAIAQTYPGFILLNLFCCFFYSLGISGWTWSGPRNAIFIPAQAANVAAVAAGGTAMYLTTSEVCNGIALICLGGMGCTLALNIWCLFSKSKRLKTLGRVCIAPAIFNINEPIIFGAIAWNPLLMLPMWLQGIILPIVTYIFTKVIPFAPIPRIQFDLWYCPYPISTFIATQGSITGVIFAILTFVLSAVIWFPFVKAYDDQKVKEETAAIKA